MKNKNVFDPKHTCMMVKKIGHTLEVKRCYILEVNGAKY
jgi:hypothetical protein